MVKGTNSGRGKAGRAKPGRIFIGKTAKQNIFGLPSEECIVHATNQIIMAYNKHRDIFTEKKATITSVKTWLLRNYLEGITRSPRFVESLLIKLANQKMISLPKKTGKGGARRKSTA